VGATLSFGVPGEAFSRGSLFLLGCFRGVSGRVLGMDISKEVIPYTIPMGSGAEGNWPIPCFLRFRKQLFSFSSASVFFPPALVTKGSVAFPKKPFRG